MRAVTALLDLLFPPKCPYCQKILDDPRAAVCPACQPELPWLEGGAGRRAVSSTRGCFSPVRYRDRVPQAIHRYKFGRVRAYAAPFGLLMAQCLEDQLPQGADMICWCPLSKERLRRRGFDQAELLARAVGERLEIPVVPALVKHRDTRPQSELEDDRARGANAQGAYAMAPGVRVEGLRVVLVDDVVTSGATMSACAGVLMEKGAAAVYGLTLAQARGDRQAEGTEEPEISLKR